MANYDRYGEAQRKAFNILKKKKPYAVIYAYSQGDGKIFLNPPLVKQSQEQVNAFVNSFRRPRQSTQVTVDVFYLSQLEKLEDYFASLEHPIEEEVDFDKDSVDPVWASEVIKSIAETRNSLKGKEQLDESAKIIVDIKSFEPWGGASNTWEIVSFADKIEELDFLLEDVYPDGITATELNDLLWFEPDWIYEMLHIDEDEIKDEIESKKLEPMEIEEE